MNKGSARGWLLLLVAIGFTFFIATRFTSAQELVATLEQGLWGWLIIAALLHALYFVLYAMVYKASFAAVGYASRLWELVPMVFVTLFVSGIVPTGGVGAAALFVEDAKRHCQSGARVTAGVILTWVIDLLTLVPFIIFANAYLLLMNDLQFYDVLGSVVFVLVAVVLGGSLVLGHERPEVLDRLLHWVQDVVNRAGSLVKRPDLLKGDWAARNARQFSAAGEAMMRHPRELAAGVFWGVAMHVVDLVGLYALFLAFRFPADPAVVTAGFAIGIVFWLISILPQGIGAAEGIMSLIYISLGVPQPVAVAAVLVFRGLNFWLPLLIGFLLLRRIGLFRSQSDVPKGGQGGLSTRPIPGTRAETEAEM